MSASVRRFTRAASSRTSSRLTSGCLAHNRSKSAKASARVTVGSTASIVAVRRPARTIIASSPKA